MLAEDREAASEETYYGNRALPTSKFRGAPRITELSIDVPAAQWAVKRSSDRVPADSHGEQIAQLCTVRVLSLDP